MSLKLNQVLTKRIAGLLLRIKYDLSPSFYRLKIDAVFGVSQ
jgi:hypothetical protein